MCSGGRQEELVVLSHGHACCAWAVGAARKRGRWATVAVATRSQALCLIARQRARSCRTLPSMAHRCPSRFSRSATTARSGWRKRAKSSHAPIHSMTTRGTAGRLSKHLTLALMCLVPATIAQALPTMPSQIATKMVVPAFQHKTRKQQQRVSVGLMRFVCHHILKESLNTIFR